MIMPEITIGGGKAKTQFAVSFDDSKNIVLTVKNEDFGLTIVKVVKTKDDLEWLKKVIPGEIDDAIINLIEKALGI